MIAGGDTERAAFSILAAARSRMDGGPTSSTGTATLLTGLLHYMLTARMISSQRKINKGYTEIDIAIPSLKVLEADPRKALLICIPSARDLPLEDQASQARRIQPVPENLWYVTEELPPEGRRYAEGDGTIHRIICDIEEFLASTGSSRLRIHSG